MLHKGMVLAFALLGISVHASFDYFNSQIDYWNEQKRAEKPPITKGIEQKTPIGGAFDWKKHLDPSSKEFFREGDYLPPEPFVELVRNPTDENIKNWFAMIQKKNELSDRMVERIQDYISKNNLEPQSKAILVEAKESLKTAPLETSRFRFRFYFDSHCPHCKRMFSTISDLQSRGFYVEAFQVDKNQGPLPGLTTSVVKASKEDIEKHQIKSVPYLLIGDIQKKVVYRLAGYQSANSVIEAINGK